MGKILMSYILPHPPILIPDVGKSERYKASGTLNAIERVAREIEELRPTTIIVTTPHGPMFQDFIHISVTPKLSGSFTKFGAANVALQFDNNIELVKSIIRHGNVENIHCGGLDGKIAAKYTVSKELDHGAAVPLYFISHQTRSFKLVHISIAGLPYIELYKFGTCIAKAVEESDENVVFIASGDLSHKLLHDGPYGFDKNGPEFDKLLVESVRISQPEKLITLDEDFCESAGECGLRSFIIMYGALDRYSLKSEVYSYEGPFGVGYCVAKIEPVKLKEGENLIEYIKRKDRNTLDKIRLEEDPYVALARKTLETYIKKGRVIDTDQELPAEMLKNRAGVFVSLKKFGQLRGCIGTIHPVRNNIAEEIINNAVSSGVQDPRFEPVEKNELDTLVYSVDVLMEPEAISSIDELDVLKYGVIVRCGARSGLLLPNLEGVDTPEKQILIALQKAGIRSDEKYKMEKFEVIRHK